MRIALVSAKWNEKANDYPPLGLAYLAAVLERDGHEVGVFDLGLDPGASIAKGGDACREIFLNPDRLWNVWAVSDVS